MFLPDNVKCSNCSKIFCCSKCRERHELKAHAHVQIQKISCPICEGKPFVLHKINSKPLIDHLVVTHLPLKCNKCLKLYQTLEDFNTIDFCNCTIKKSKKMKNSPKENKENVEPQLETIPELYDGTMNKNDTFSESDYKSIDDGGGDPQKLGLTRQLSTPNMNCGSDSGYSLQNVSSINRSSQLVNRIQSPQKKKLVRSTSTPMQPLQFDFKKPTSFDHSGSAYMSSIAYNSITSNSKVSSSSLVTSDAENSVTSSRDISSGTSFLIKKQTMPNGRMRLPVEATPLRQVMSKSIQRAIAKHGIKNIHEIRVKPALSFGSGSTDSISSCGSSVGSTSPLDLRTTPVIRRSKRSLSTPEYTKIEEPKHSIHKTFEMSKLKGDSKNSIDEIEKSDTLYTTCQDNSNELMTPKYGTNHITAIIKKTISFESSPVENTPVIGIQTMPPQSDHQQCKSEIWYTPESTGLERSLSCSALESKRNLLSKFENQMTKIQSDDSLDEVFYATHTPNTETSHKKMKLSGTGGGRKIWSLVTSVMKMASFSGNSHKFKSNADNLEMTATGSTGEQSFLKRYASFSGWMNSTESSGLSKSTYQDDQQQPYSKRRKTSSDIQQLHFNGSSSGGESSYVEGIHRKKIQARMPIRKTRN